MENRQIIEEIIGQANTIFCNIQELAKLEEVEAIVFSNNEKEHQEQVNNQGKGPKNKKDNLDVSVYVDLLIDEDIEIKEEKELYEWVKDILPPKEKIEDYLIDRLYNKIMLEIYDYINIYIIQMKADENTSYCKKRIEYLKKIIEIISNIKNEKVIQEDKNQEMEEMKIIFLARNGKELFFEELDKTSMYQQIDVKKEILNRLEILKNGTYVNKSDTVMKRLSFCDAFEMKGIRFRIICHQLTKDTVVVSNIFIKKSQNEIRLRKLIIDMTSEYEANKPYLIDQINNNSSAFFSYENDLFERLIQNLKSGVKVNEK
jgi:hypothetical protein